MGAVQAKVECNRPPTSHGHGPQFPYADLKKHGTTLPNGRTDIAGVEMMPRIERAQEQAPPPPSRAVKGVVPVHDSRSTVTMSLRCQSVHPKRFGFLGGGRNVPDVCGSCEN